MERLWQLRLSSRKRLPLLPTETAQRQAVHRLASVTEGRLVLFSLVFEHGHILTFSSEQRLGLVRRTIRQVLQPVCAQPIEPLWHEAVDGRGHMQSLLRYLIAQPEHHRLEAHPALWSGSCFPDLVGARWVPGLRLRLSEALPGFRLRDAHDLVGLPPRRIEPADDDQIRALGAARLVSATAAALAIDPLLAGRRPIIVLARRLVLQLGRRLGLPWGELARSVPVTRATLFRSVTDLLVAPRLEQVVRTRLALEEATWPRR
jgi:hypothetical protein